MLENLRESVFSLSTKCLKLNKIASDWSGKVRLKPAGERNFPAPYPPWLKPGANTVRVPKRMNRRERRVRRESRGERVGSGLCSLRLSASSAVRAFFQALRTICLCHHGTGAYTKQWRLQRDKSIRLHPALAGVTWEDFASSGARFSGASCSWPRPGRGGKH